MNAQWLVLAAIGGLICGGVVIWFSWIRVIKDIIETFEHFREYHKRWSQEETAKEVLDYVIEELRRKIRF